MNRLGCATIHQLLSKLVSRYGWDGYTYTFTQTQHWNDKTALLVREASDNLRPFLDQYEKSNIQYTHMEMSVLQSDFPQSFEMDKLGDSPADRQLLALFKKLGWRSGLGYPSFSYGGALSLVVLYSKRALVPQTAEASVDQLCPLMPQLNAWARETLVESTQMRCRELSTREMDCMLLAAEGKTSKDIADMLFLSKRTIDFHIQNAVEKMGAPSRNEAAARLALASQPRLQIFGNRTIKPQKSGRRINNTKAANQDH